MRDSYGLRDAQGTYSIVLQLNVCSVCVIGLMSVQPMFSLDASIWFSQYEAVSFQGVFGSVLIDVRFASEIVFYYARSCARI